MLLVLVGMYTDGKLGFDISVAGSARLHHEESATFMFGLASGTEPVFGHAPGLSDSGDSATRRQYVRCRYGWIKVYVRAMRRAETVMISWVM